MRNMLKDVKTVRVVNAQTAGTTTVNGSIIDLSGFDACRFTCLLNTLTATQTTSLLVQVGNSPTLADAATLLYTDGMNAQTANALDGDSNKLLQVDFIKPSGYRYCRCQVVRGVANAVIDGVIADLYQAVNIPVTLDTTVSQSKFGVAHSL